MSLIKDSRGHPSWHFTLAIPALILGTLWFLIGGVDVTIASIHLTTATKSGSDYLLYITPWLGAIGCREWIDKANNASSNS